MIALRIDRDQSIRTGIKDESVDGRFDIISFKDMNVTSQSLTGASVNLVFQFSSYTDLIDGEIIELNRKRDLLKDPTSGPRQYVVERANKSRVGMNTYSCSEAP